MPLRLTANRKRLALRALHQGRSIADICNSLRLSFIDVITIQQSLPKPKRVKISKQLHSSIRNMRDFGFNIKGIMRHHDLTRIEVMESLRKTKE
jgi:hypothetical protein